MVDRIERVEPNQVSITTTLVDASFPFYISAGGPNWWTVLPSRPKVHDDSQEAVYEKNPIAAGPMSLVEYVPASVMRFERFDDFYYQPKNGLPEDRRVNFQLLDMFLVPEEATRVAALRAGEADIAPVSLATRKQVEEGGGRVVFGREAGYIYAGLIGCYEPQFPCHDKRVRQALAYAFDKEMIRDRLFGGPEAFGVEGWAYVTPSSIGYTPDLDSVPFDPEKARQLLAEAGYKTPTSPDGKDFGKLIVNTWPSAVTPFLPESAQLAADYWRRELGIDSEVRVGDEVSMKRSEDALELQGQILWRDDEAVADGGKKVRDLAQTDKPSPEHKDPEIHKMAAEAGAVLEPTQREAALNQMYRRYRDESYRLGVGYYNVPWGVGPRVVEWQPWPFSFYPSNLHSIVLK
jgi:peptide/nickel transport system substrate-binding protein